MKYAGYSFALPPTAHNQMLFLRLSMTAFIALDEDEKQRVVIRAGCSGAQKPPRTPFWYFCCTFCALDEKYCTLAFIISPFNDFPSTFQECFKSER